MLPTRMPCMRDMARSGLSARSVRIVLKAWMPPAPRREAVKLMRETWRLAQGLVRLLQLAGGGLMASNSSHKLLDRKRRVVLYGIS